MLRAGEQSEHQQFSMQSELQFDCHGFLISSEEGEVERCPGCFRLKI